MDTRVANIMTRLPVTISPEANLLDCAKRMVKKRVGSLILVKNQKLVGFISQKDILWAMVKKSKKDLSKIKAKDISAKKIATIRPDSTLKQAVNKMKKVKFQRLPVIEGNNLVGVLTMEDILSFNPQIYPELEELSKIKEESIKLERVKNSKERKIIKEGICEECGNLEFLYKIDGRLICESCKEMM